MAMMTDRGGARVFQPVYEYDLTTSAEAAAYRPRAYGEMDLDGRWNGWLVFFPLVNGTVVATASETSQATLPALVDWASGLTRAHLQAALERALDLRAVPIAALGTRELQAIEAEATDRADILERAAAVAYRIAAVAAARRTEAVIGAAHDAARRKR
jgi:hypothetical protein